MATRAKNSILVDFYQEGINIMTWMSSSKNTGSLSGTHENISTWTLNTSTTKATSIQKNTGNITTSSQTGQKSTNTSTLNPNTIEPTTNNQSSISVNWTENLIYEAISNGEINRKIEKGEIKMNPTSATKEMVASAINRFRADYGLSPLSFSPVLANAAKSHSDYMIINGNSEWHNETFGKSGFSGKTPTDRAKSLGYTSWVAENIAHIQGDIVTSLVNLMDVPYHRMGFLEDSRDIWFCTDASCYGVFEFGWNQISNASSFIFPKNGSNIYRYNELISENPNPFPWYSLNGFVMSIWDNSPIDQTKVRLVDVATNKDVPIRFAVPFNSTCTSSVCLTINTSQTNIKSQNSVHFINTEALIEWKTYMVEYAIVYKDTVTTRRSYFVAWTGKMSSNLLPTKASGKLSEVWTTLDTNTSITSENSQIKTGYLSITKDPSGQYTFTYVDMEAKIAYNLIFTQQDIDWIIKNKRINTEWIIPSWYEMSIIENARFMLANIRKPYNVSWWEFAMYEADAKIAP